MMVGLTFLGYHNDEHFDDKTVVGFAMSVMISPLRTELPVLPPRKRGNIQNVRLIQLHATFMKVKRNDGHFFICILRFTIRPIFLYMPPIIIQANHHYPCRSRSRKRIKDLLELHAYFSS